MLNLKNDIKNLFTFLLITSLVFLIVTNLIEINKILGLCSAILIFGRLQVYHSEVLHEASHYNFFKSFRINDKITNLILYPLLLITVQQNRKSHFIHHKFKDSGNEYFSEEDPETGIFNPNDFRLSNVLKDLIGFTSLKLFLKKNIYKKKEEKVPILQNLIYYIYAFLFWFLLINLNQHGLEILICWGISALTIYSFLNRVRIYFMHKNINSTENISRNLKSDFFSNIFISKMMLNHDMHHKYPFMPYRELNKLTEEKMAPKERCFNLIKLFKKNNNEMSIL